MGITYNNKKFIDSINNVLKSAKSQNKSVYDLSEEVYESCGCDIHEIAADLASSKSSPLLLSAEYEKSLSEKEKQDRGAFYTQSHLIHMLIDPLFTLRLEAELADCRNEHNRERRLTMLHEYRNTLGQIRLMDPACGDGNILVESYMSLRLLDIKAMQMLSEEGEHVTTPVVTTNHFYGIEIDPESANMARLLMSISELVCCHLQNEYLNTTDIPSCSNGCPVVVGDSLEIKWENVMPRKGIPLVVGNPPFKGWQRLTPEQKNQLFRIAGEDCKGMDYAGAWFFKAADYLTDNQGNPIGRFAFISNANLAFGSQKYKTLPRILKKGWHHCLSCPPTAWKSIGSSTSVNTIINGFDSEEDCIRIAEKTIEVNRKPEQLGKAVLLGTDDYMLNPILMNFAGYLDERNYDVKPMTDKLADDLSEFSEVPYEGMNNLVIVNSPTENHQWMHPYYENNPEQKNFNHYCDDVSGITFSIVSSRAFQLWRFMTCSRSRGDASITKTMTWNTFPLRKLTAAEQAKLIAHANNITAIRAQHAKVKNLYNPNIMPADLKKAHEELDKDMNLILTGRKAPTDKELREAMYGLYQQMEAEWKADASNEPASVHVNKPASKQVNKPTSEQVDNPSNQQASGPVMPTAEPTDDIDKLTELIMAGDKEALAAYEQQLCEQDTAEYETEFIEARRKAMELRESIRRRARASAMKSVKLTHNKISDKSMKNPNGNGADSRDRFIRQIDN